MAERTSKVFPVMRSQKTRVRCHRYMHAGARDEFTVDASAAHDYTWFEVHYPALRRFAAVVADLDTDPDDLVQDALAATLARTTLPELDAPVAYLKRAILNQMSNRRRSAGRFRRLFPKIASHDSSSDHYPSDLSILDELSPLDRAIIYLAYVDGLPHDDIATQLELAPTAVRKRASRARARLREAVDDSASTTATTSTTGGSR